MKSVFLASTAILFALVLFSACKSSGTANRAQGAQVVQIAVTQEGFVPSSVKVSKGQPVKLVITRKTERTCATEIVIKDYGIDQKLPLNQPVEVVFTPTKSGTVQYACGMNMIKGQLEVE